MKKSYLTVVLTLTCLLGLGISAHAQDVGKVAVNVPLSRELGFPCKNICSPALVFHFRGTCDSC
jgi:hypothetical protein